MPFKKLIQFLSVSIFIVSSLSVIATENIVENGSFEEHAALNHGNWGILSDIPGWSAEVGHFEIQRGRVAGLAASEGSDKLELDANFNSSIYTDLSTEIDQPYILKFSYSPRVQQKNTNTNNIEVWWEGNKIALLSGSKRKWKEKNYLVKAVSGVSRLKFKAVGKSDSLGGFIDNVQVIPLMSLGEDKVVNGSFETHGAFNHGNWGTFSSILGWTATQGLLEIQTGNISGIHAVDGVAKAELDSNRNSKIRQRFTDLKDGELYQLILSYSPRINHRNSNKIKLRWNNQKIAILNDRNKKWRQVFFTVKAKATNILDLHAIGKSDSLGGLIDDIQLYCLSCKNIIPIARAGNDQTIIIGESVSFDGRESSDEDGEITTYEWQENQTVISVEAQFNKSDFSVGEHQITLTVTDDKGATSSDVVIITVEELPNTAPIAESLTVSTLENTLVAILLTASDEEQQTLNYSIVNQPENGSISGTAPELSYTPNTGFFGTDSFSFKANDGLIDSNTATVSINIARAPDTIAPVITINGSDLITLEQGSEYTDAGATATDNRDGSIDVVTTGTVDVNIAGSYTLTYTATDTAGNVATATRKVTITPIQTDTTPPVITLNGGDITIEVGGVYTELGATAFDDRDGTITVEISGTLDTSTVGSYVLSYTAVDSSGNTSIQKRIVTILKISSNDIKFIPSIIGQIGAGGRYTIRNISIVDINRDAKEDILLSSTSGLFWLEYSNHSYTKHLINNASSDYSYATDVDNDGDIDVLAVFDSYYVKRGVYWFENKGDEVFEEHKITNRVVNKVEWGDIDTDGDLDVLLGIEGTTVWVENDGNQNFLMSRNTVDVFNSGASEVPYLYRTRSIDSK